MGINFEPEPESGSQKYSEENTDRLCIFIVHDRNNQRQDGCYQQYTDNRIFKFLKEKFPQRSMRRWSDDIFSKLFAALLHF